MKFLAVLSPKVAPIQSFNNPDLHWLVYLLCGSVSVHPSLSTPIVTSPGQASPIPSSSASPSPLKVWWRCK